jgi:probable rRNA maturation factor
VVEILDETNRYARAEPLAAAVAALLADYGVVEVGVTIVLLDDDAMRERNLADRGIDAPTDVLSYPTNEPDDEDYPRIPHLGDIFVSLDTAARQAHERGHPLETEVLVLAAHGLMHLRGHDHPDDASWAAFRRAQNRIVELAELSA